MLRNLKIIVLFILVISCSKKVKNEQPEYYVLKKLESGLYSKDNLNKRTLNKLFYGEHTFIIIDTTKIYYHNLSKNYFCGTGIDFTKPPKLDLSPNNLKVVENNNLKSFLDTISKNKNNYSYLFGSISSPKDTIRSKAFKILIEYFKRNGIEKYNIRKWTEEEKFVSEAKYANKKYKSVNIKWIIGFDHTDKFTRPREIK